jgi:hypothetical protein
VVIYRVAFIIWYRPLSLEPLIMPKPLDDQGYTGAVAAQRVVDDIIRIEQATQTISRRASQSVGGNPLPDIEAPLPLVTVPDPLSEVDIPDTKISIASAIDLFASQPHIIVEVTSESTWHDPESFHPNIVTISVDITGDQSLRRNEQLSVESASEVIDRVARQVIEMVDPVLLARYMDYVEHDPNAALRLLQEANTLDPPKS